MNCFNLIFPQTAQQQHMAFSEILLLQFGSWADRDTRRLGTLQRTQYVSISDWERKTKLWAQFLSCIVLGSQGLSPGMDPCYKNCKWDLDMDRRQLQTQNLMHLISTAISIISNECISSRQAHDDGFVRCFLVAWGVWLERAVRSSGPASWRLSATAPPKISIKPGDPGAQDPQSSDLKN